MMSLLGGNWLDLSQHEHEWVASVIADACQSQYTQGIQQKSYTTDLARWYTGLGMSQLRLGVLLGT